MWRLLLIVSGFGWLAIGHAQSPESSATPPIRVGVLNDNFPFSYRTTEAAPQGFAVELFAGIEEVMALRTERVVGNTDTINRAFRAGEIDLLQSYASSPERAAHANFSVPYLVMEGAVFARPELRRIKTLPDLRGRRVLVHRGSLGEQLLQAHGLADSIVHVESVEQAFRMIEAGEGDATLAARLTGAATIHFLGLRQVKVTDAVVDGYRVEYCLAVQAGDDELLARINEGLAILRSTGRFESIYRRWFGHLDPRGFTVLEVVSAVAAGLAVALLITLWAFVRQRALRRRIAAQAGALQVSEERYRALFEASPVGLLVVSPDPAQSQEFVLQSSNPAGLRLFNWTAAPPAGTRLREVAPDHHELWEQVDHRLNNPAGGSFEVGVTLRSDSTVWIRGAVASIGQDRLIVLSDITEEKSAADRLQQQEKMLRETQKLEALGTLSNGIAHDFNNILAGILGNTELARLDVPVDSPPHLFLTRVLEAGERARLLVRQILAFSRESKPSRQPVDLTGLVDEVLRFMRAATPQSIALRHETKGTIPQIMGDPTQIHQVLMNVCTNAVQAMRGSGGQLTIRESVVEPLTKAPGGPGEVPPPAASFVQITVADTGSGMSADVVRRIFEPFFTTRPPGEGTGLGLAVVHGIMTSHGGTVTVDSTPGQGTKFHLQFPIGAQAEREDNPLDPSASKVRIEGRRILLVDDETIIAASLGEILRRRGAEVAVFTDPAHALANFERNPTGYDTVICDLTMPKLNGISLARAIRAQRPDIPLIIMSGHVSDAEREQAQQLGVQALLPKPVPMSLLFQTVAEVTTRDSREG